MNRMSARGIVTELKALAGDWRAAAREVDLPGQEAATQRRQGRAEGLTMAADLIAKRWSIDSQKGGPT